MTRDLITNLSLLTALIFLSNSFFKPSLPRASSSNYKWKIGALYGVFGILLMNFSVHIDNVTILDYRQIIVIAAAHFGGLPASILSALIIGLGRIALFGGLNKSSITATVLIIIMGTGSGLIFHYVQHYWKRWLMSILLSIAALSASLVWILVVEQARIVVMYYSLLTLIGGLFVAYLVQYLSNADKLIAQLEASEARYRRLATLHEAIFNAPAELAFVVTDSQGTITMFNRGAEKMLGYEAAELENKQSVAHLYRSCELGQPGNEAGGARAFDAIVSEAGQGDAAAKEWIFAKKDGGAINVSVMISPVMENGNSPSGYLFVVSDVTQKKEAEAQLMEANRMLHRLSRLDGLTQIPNRRSLDESLAVCWERAVRQSQALSFIMLDIDYFKLYNDTYGHQGGDECLKQVAAAILRSIRPDNDEAARYGGEEFAIVLPATKLEQAAQIAEKARAAVEAMNIQHANSKAGPRVTVSLGVATIIPYPGADPCDLISMADKALYRAKQEGRNRVLRYNQ